MSYEIVTYETFYTIYLKIIGRWVIGLSPIMRRWGRSFFLGVFEFCKTMMKDSIFLIMILCNFLFLRLGFSSIVFLGLDPRIHSYFFVQKRSHRWIFWLVFLCSSVIFSKNQFMALVEDSSVNKNNFLCPFSLDATGNVVCKNMDAEMVGFDMAGGHTIQIFNNQQYWLQQKFERQQILIVRGYTGDRLSSTMSQEGWDHMGAFSIILTTDPIVVTSIRPEMKAQRNQTKLVAQLWYSAANELQLWAEDVMILEPNQNFTISVSHTSSALFDGSAVSVGSKKPSLPSTQATTLPTIPTDMIGFTNTLSTDTRQKDSKVLQKFKEEFVQQVGFSPRNLDKNIYGAAYGSPRSIKIQVQ